MAAKLPALMLISAVLICGGEFRTRFNKAETVTLAVPHPAEMVLSAKTMGLKYVPGGAPPNRIIQLSQLIEQDLSRQFQVTNMKPDASLQFAVIAYEPVRIANETKSEMRTINVGSADKPKFEQRTVPVVYELVHGSITVGATVNDGTGRTIDAFQPSAVIAERTELTVNGQATNQQVASAPATGNSWSTMLNIKTPRPQAKPAAQTPVVRTAEGIETEMLQTLASKIRQRYASSTDKVEIALAVDSELRLGDKLAESGQWKEALDSWKAADMKRNASDRLYNMAVGKEALAYAELTRDSDMDAFLPKFEEAMDLYTEALHGDPNEKYMRDSVDRLQLAKANIEAARRMKVEQDTAANRAVTVAAENARNRKLQEAAVNDHHPDSPDEASFRVNVRAELADIKGEVSDQDRNHMIAFGERLKLTELQSYRVVGQEIERRKQIGLALQDYERVFRSLAADGRITASERAQLRDLARKEDLDATDVKSVEDKYHFTDETPSGSHPAKTASRAARSNQ